MEIVRLASQIDSLGWYPKIFAVPLPEMTFQKEKKRKEKKKKPHKLMLWEHDNMYF